MPVQDGGNMMHHAQGTSDERQPGISVSSSLQMAIEKEGILALATSKRRFGGCVMDLPVKPFTDVGALGCASPLNQVNLNTSFALSELQHVDAWGAPFVSRATNSLSSVASTTDTNLVEKLNIDRAEPAFITDASSYVHHIGSMLYSLRRKK
ncbi:hypothetical protein B0H34DRAFT_806156 [Crassisporium funariophilum]|nr:hypothetical protein B0H34DRAFT_806156 [Crassisporium funariophilum]